MRITKTEIVIEGDNLSIDDALDILAVLDVDPTERRANVDRLREALDEILAEEDDDEEEPSEPS